MVIKSTTAEVFQVVASLDRHLNSNSRMDVYAKLSQLYSLMLNDMERKKCLERCFEQFDRHSVGILLLS